jgi:DNA-binding MarR family transcriptional regulator
VNPSRSDGAGRAEEEEASLGRVLDFMRLLWAVNHGLTQVSKRMGRRLGVTGPQRLVVRIVGQRPGISAGALAEVLHLHPSTLTGILQRLTARGAIERTRDPADTRRALFRLTRRGLEIDALRSGTVEARVRAALASFSYEDLATAGRVLARLAEALSQGPRTPLQLSPLENRRRR